MNIIASCELNFGQGCDDQLTLTLCIDGQTRTASCVAPKNRSEPLLLQIHPESSMNQTAYVIHYKGRYFRKMRFFIFPSWTERITDAQRFIFESQAERFATYSDLHLPHDGFQIVPVL